MTIQTQDIQIVSENETSMPSLSEFQQKALEVAEKELEDLKKEMEGKKYLIDLKKPEIEMLSSFISNDAPWKFTECLGIVEIEKEMKNCIKTGKLFVSAVAVEAIYYYMSKVDGLGNGTNTKTFKTVEDYLKILKPITSGVERIKADTEKVRQAEFVVAARREGIEPEAPIKK
jgi:hypothetical protein